MPEKTKGGKTPRQEHGARLRNEQVMHNVNYEKCYQHRLEESHRRTKNEKITLQTCGTSMSMTLGPAVDS